MSKLAPFDALLEQYYAFEYHKDEQLLKRLRDTQAWLKDRIRYTHQDFFNLPENKKMASYFLNRLYGGEEFDPLALQIERLVKYAHKAEKFLPENAIKTGTQSVGLAIYSTQLDEQVAKKLLEDYPIDEPLTDEIIRQTLLKVDQKGLRLQQLSALDQLGEALDKYMRSFMMHTAFKMCKSTAYKHNFALMYEFIEEGFVAMKPLKSAEKFITQFTQKERDIVEKVHAGDTNPFR